MPNDDFKERVKNILISEARGYKESYVNYQYLVCSGAFKHRDYYIVDAKEDNYRHLTGVNSLIDAQEFFNKCYEGTLSIDDFNFIKRGQDEKSVKGSVRRKIQVLPYMMRLFDSELMAEESFEKNKVKCSFATTDKKCTLGFIDAKKSRPMTLLKGDETNQEKVKSITLVLRKQNHENKFNEVVMGEQEQLLKYYDKIKGLIHEELLHMYNTTK
ncbi:MAG: PBECR4 domain-containing protein [Cellulosilyticaceae bacterium]